MRICHATVVCAIGATALGTVSAHADFTFDVIGGQTSVLLDTELLASAAGLNLSGVSPDVIVPGDLGAGSVAFGISSPSDMPPTTFSYDPGLTSFGGVIEHTGSVFFNDDAIQVGNFRIGFDAGLAGGNASGFFVESTTGVEAILFDIGNPSSLTADETGLMITADLLVSSSFAQLLLDLGLAQDDLTGADVGDAMVAGVVPAPGAIALLGLAGLVGSRRRRA